MSKRFKKPLIAHSEQKIKELKLRKRKKTPNKNAEPPAGGAPPGPLPGAAGGAANNGAGPSVPAPAAAEGSTPQGAGPTA
jgi:hypothetical protein